MSAAERITALEAEVAELRAFVPMLARMAFYESYCGRSMPSKMLGMEDELAPDQEYSPVFERPEDEAVPSAAQALQDQHDHLDETGGLTAWQEGLREAEIDRVLDSLSGWASFARSPHAAECRTWLDLELHRLVGELSRVTAS